MDEGLQILKMLASHPSTARFISTKLVRRFVADDPPAAVVDAASRAFTESGGDIREVLRTIFSSPEFFSRDYFLGKTKKPLELVVSALRTVNAAIDTGLGSPMFYLGQTLTQMGENLYRHNAPDGYADIASAWISTSSLFRRMDFAIVLATGNIADTTVDIDAAHALFQQLEYPSPTSGQLAGVQSISKQMSQNIMANEMEMDSGMAQNDMMQKPEASSIGQEITDAGVLATVVALGSPRFQKR